jgi:SAM-dependent methyltransferase
MIARLWWPWLSWCLDNRWLIDAAILVAVALMTARSQHHFLAWSQFSGQQQAALILSVLLVWYAAGRPGSALGGILAMALGAATAWSIAPPDATGMTLLIACAAAVQVPQLIELRTVKHRDQALRASARGLGVLLPGMALATPALLTVGGWPLVVGGLVAVFSAMVLPLTWCRLDPTPATVLPTPLPARTPHLMVARAMQVAVVVLVALGAIDVVLRLIAANLPLWQLLLPITLIAVWHAVTGRVLVALAAVLTSCGWMGYAFLGRTPWSPDAVLIGLAAAQPLALCLWHARQGHRQWPGLLLILIGLIPALALNDVFAIGGAALAACLAVVVSAPRPLATMPRAGLADADTVLTRARRACQRMTPYWRHYGVAKLRYDPVYRQLAERTLPWGRVLDAGCGPGLVAALAAARGEPAYCGIDLDDTKLEAAADLLEFSGQPLVGDWRLIRAQLPLAQTPTMRFDTVMLIDVLHYWPESEQEAVVRQLRNVLDAGGLLYLRDGVTDDQGATGAVGLGELFTTFFGLNPGGSGLHFLTEPAMRALLERCGFRVEACDVSGGANRLWRCTAVTAPTDTPTGAAAQPQ